MKVEDWLYDLPLLPVEWALTAEQAPTEESLAHQDPACFVIIHVVCNEYMLDIGGGVEQKCSSLEWKRYYIPVRLLPLEKVC